MGFDEEQSKVKNLMLQVAEMEGKIEQTTAALGQMKSEREKLIEENKLMESRVDILLNEKDVVHKNLLEAQRDSDDLRAKIEFSSSNLNQALAMLKSTAAIVCHSKTGKGSAEELDVNGRKLEVEIQPYAEELDAIKNAFRNKNKMVEDMKQQLASLENSLAEAHKRKNFWTVISSATTILATALAAHVARGH
ncbi:hypothetical protein L6164_010543 [Bauhinia variegata]|nr:hypothetical protein L6164_010543 [Bauhinia variegata]